MKNYGFVATGGGYRSFYTAGVLLWLKKNGYNIVQINSNSSGNNTTLDYLLWDYENEDFPPNLTQTFRMGLVDIFDILSNILGLKPSLLNNGSYLFTVDVEQCQQSLFLNDPKRRKILEKNLKNIKWDIVVTNLTKREKERFHINDLLPEVTDDTLNNFMPAFISGITTIPYFKAVEMNGDYYIEGGYMDNSPLRSVFENPDVDEIIVMDFTEYDYHTDLKEAYGAMPILSLFNNGIEMNKLVNDIELNLPNKNILKAAEIINEILRQTGKEGANFGGVNYKHKPLHILRPYNLKSMTISLKDSNIPKEYFELGQKEIEEHFKNWKEK